MIYICLIILYFLILSVLVCIDMNVLIISKCPTHPLSSGNRKFIYNQVQLFESMGHNVFFFYIHEEGLRSSLKSDNVVSQMNSFWKERLCVYNVPFIAHLYNMFLKKIRIVLNRGYVKADDDIFPFITRKINNFIREKNIDCAIINYYYLSRLLTNLNVRLKALTTHDYFSYKTILTGIKGVDLNTTAGEEAKALQRSPHIFALNTEEEILFRKLSPASKTYNVFCNYEYFPTDYCGNKNILFFSGGNKYNLDGLNWFIDTVYPLILSRFPDAQLIIGGSITKFIDFSKITNSVNYGYVDDVNHFFSQGDVVINPTYQGTGLKIKTFEAISYSKVVMVHPHSMIGIYDSYNAPIFSSDLPQDWVEYLSTMWSSEAEVNRQKNKCGNYIHEMNMFIRSEYERFFNSIKTAN